MCLPGPADDPSGFAAYAPAGAIFGYGRPWPVRFTLPFMTVIRQMCGRIGLVTGEGQGRPRARRRDRGSSRGLENRP